MKTLTTLTRQDLEKLQSEHPDYRMELASSPEAPHHSGTPLSVGMDRRVADGIGSNQSIW